MNRIKHILSITKSYLRRSFKPGSKKWLHSSKGGFLDLLPGFGGNFDMLRSFVYACISALAVNIYIAKIYLYRNKPARWNKKIIVHKFPDSIAKPVKRIRTFSQIPDKIASCLDLYCYSGVFINRSQKNSQVRHYHLPSGFMDIKLNDCQTEISHYVNYTGGKPQKFPLENIINFMIPDTWQ